MKSMFKHLSRFRNDEKGTTLVEYGIALLVAIVVGGTALITLANSVTTNFNAANTAVQKAPGVTY